MDKLSYAKSLKEWREALHSGRTAQLWRELRENDIPACEARLQQLLADFQAVFSCSEQEQLILLSAPGRTELIGNHTDHQGGKVLAAAVNRDILALASFNQEDKPAVLRICSQNRPPLEVELSSLEPRSAENHHSSAMVRGIACGLVAQGLEARGLNILMDSRVPAGSGISSSAAFELAIAVCLSSLWPGPEPSPETLARISQMAENKYFQKPSGLMDQMAVALGGVVFMDFGSTPLKIERLPLDLEAYGYHLLITDSRSDHRNLSPAYAAIRQEMEAVAAEFGEKSLSTVAQADVLRDLPRLRKATGDRALLRALHYFDECERVEEARQALRSHNFKHFLTCLEASGNSSFKYLQNIYPQEAVKEQAMALALALAGEFSNGQASSRVHGGGFGGTILSLLPIAESAAFREKMDKVFGPAACQEMLIREAGAQILTVA